MCKYCKFVLISNVEKSNNCKAITKLKDGSRELEVSLNRYYASDCNSQHKELVIDEAVTIDTGELFYVKHKAIPIKYCPFCGEEL